MDQPVLIGGGMNTEKRILEDSHEGMSVPNDRSASVYAAVIGNAGLSVDDGLAAKMAPAALRNRSKTGTSAQKQKAKKNLQEKKLSLALLQEKHALWLK